MEPVIVRVFFDGRELIDLVRTDVRVDQSGPSRSLGGRQRKGQQMSELEGEVGTGGVTYDRPLVGVWWEPGDYEGNVRIRAVNAESGDVGVKRDVNDGEGFLTYPHGATVTDHVEVWTDREDGEADELIAEFDISVKVA